MAEGFVHTVFKNEQWINELELGDQVSGPHDTKEDAVERGRSIAMERKTEHVIHNENGEIGYRHSYGNDPASSPG
jgi:hypothetical protein